MAVPGLSRRGGGVLRAHGSLESVADGSETGWSAGGQGMQALHGGVDVACPGPGAVEADSDSAAGADEPAGDGEQAQPQPFRFGDSVLSGQGQGLGPGEQVLGELDDLEPEAVGRIVLVGQISHAGVFSAADPVFAAGAAAVPAFQLGELPFAGVGDEAGDAVAVEVGDSQLGAGV